MRWSRGGVFASRPTRRRPRSLRPHRHPRLRLRNGWLCSSSASPPWGRQRCLMWALVLEGRTLDDLTRSWAGSPVWSGPAGRPVLCLRTALDGSAPPSSAGFLPWSAPAAQTSRQGSASEESLRPRWCHPAPEEEVGLVGAVEGEAGEVQQGWSFHYLVETGVPAEEAEEAGLEERQ